MRPVAIATTGVEHQTARPDPTFSGGTAAPRVAPNLGIAVALFQGSLPGELDQHIRSLTHLLAAGKPLGFPPGRFSRVLGDEYHS